MFHRIISNLAYYFNNSRRSNPRFDPEFYLAIYPDIAAAGVDPYEHYINHGRSEGRLARMPAELDALNDFRTVALAKEAVLVVIHEGVRGGAPILAYTLVKELLEKYNVIVLFLAGGPLLKSCHDAGALVVGPVGLAGSRPLAEMVINRICRTVPIKFAIVNTIASRYVLPALSKRYVPTVSLIHEFAAYIRPRSAFTEAAFWSGQVVFSTELTRDAAISEFPELRGKEYPVIPQGLCIIPKDEHEIGSKKGDEKAYIRRLLRPDGFPSEGVVALGAGFVDFRKGVDLFIDCAARLVKRTPEVPIRFVWIGRGYNPENDVGYSGYLEDQIRRSGMEKHVFFMDEISDLPYAYGMADLLLLSSRLDPLPNVAIDALALGLPVICFEKTTGIAEILRRNGLGEFTVAGYLDTDDMAHKIASLVRSKELRAHVASQSSSIANKTFSTKTYLARIEAIAAEQILQAEQEKNDVETIAKSSLYVSNDQAGAINEDAIREYVRSSAAGMAKQCIFANFRPEIYCEQHGLQLPKGNPLADYLRAGQPTGPWVLSEDSFA